MLVSNCLAAFFKSSFGFCVVCTHGHHPSLYSLQKANPARWLYDLGWSTWLSLTYCEPLSIFYNRTRFRWSVSHQRQWSIRETILLAIYLPSCLVTRAVLIETCADLNTETTLIEIRSFVALRENSQQIYSDKAKTFTKATKELKNGITKLRTDNSLRDALLLLHLDWRFIPPVW